MENLQLLYELVENTIFTEIAFADCSLVLPKDATPPNITEKIFSEEPLNLEIRESFLPPQKFPAVGYLGLPEGGSTRGSTQGRVYPREGLPEGGSTRGRVYLREGLPEGGSTRGRVYPREGLPEGGST